MFAYCHSWSYEWIRACCFEIWRLWIINNHFVNSTEVNGTACLHADLQSEESKTF